MYVILTWQYFGLLAEPNIAVAVDCAHQYRSDLVVR